MMTTMTTMTSAWLHNAVPSFRRARHKKNLELTNVTIRQRVPRYHSHLHPGLSTCAPTLPWCGGAHLSEIERTALFFFSHSFVPDHISFCLLIHTCCRHEAKRGKFFESDTCSCATKLSPSPKNSQNLGTRTKHKKRCRWVPLYPNKQYQVKNLPI